MRIMVKIEDQVGNARRAYIDNEVTLGQLKAALIDVSNYPQTDSQGRKLHYELLVNGQTRSDDDSLDDITDGAVIDFRPQMFAGGGGSTVAPPSLETIRRLTTANIEDARVFLSYRRQETEDLCGRIFDRLSKDYGQKQIFRDLNSIPLGVDFKGYLQKVINQCAVMLVLIGMEWIAIKDESGIRRLDDPNDFVRFEVEIGINCHIPIIPLFAHGAVMPKLQELPSTIQQLAYFNGISIHSDPYFHSNVDMVVQRIDQLLKSRN
ncbi:MAG: toll/interleukin-1 receptor domain-containing protein [Ktedonobacterales bacterium]|nr:toll/interleukin-1 receptor domain-containing protein [Ktedonobacterales bacterium]